MFLLVLGLILLTIAETVFKDTGDHCDLLTASGFLTAMGFFGTFSGITNLVANVSLFYGIPFFPGVG